MSVYNADGKTLATDQDDAFPGQKLVYTIEYCVADSTNVGTLILNDQNAVITDGYGKLINTPSADLGTGSGIGQAYSSSTGWTLKPVEEGQATGGTAHDGTVCTPAAGNTGNQAAARVTLTSGANIGQLQAVITPAQVNGQYTGIADGLYTIRYEVDIPNNATIPNTDTLTHIKANDLFNSSSPVDLTAMTGEKGKSREANLVNISAYDNTGTNGPGQDSGTPGQDGNGNLITDKDTSGNTVNPGQDGSDNTVNGNGAQDSTGKPVSGLAQINLAAAPNPHWTLEKDASSPSVVAGATLNYTVTVVNDGNVDLPYAGDVDLGVAPMNDPAVNDDMTDVLNNADYNGDFAEKTVSPARAAGLTESTAVFTTPDLAIQFGSLLIGQKDTVGYSVAVHGDAGIGSSPKPSGSNTPEAGNNGSGASDSGSHAYWLENVVKPVQGTNPAADKLPVGDPTADSKSDPTVLTPTQVEPAGTTEGETSNPGLSYPSGNYLVNSPWNLTDQAAGQSLSNSDVAVYITPVVPTGSQGFLQNRAVLFVGIAAVVLAAAGIAWYVVAGRRRQAARH